MKTALRCDQLKRISLLLVEVNCSIVSHVYSYDVLKLKYVIAVTSRKSLPSQHRKSVPITRSIGIVKYFWTHYFTFSLIYEHVRGPFEYDLIEHIC